MVTGSDGTPAQNDADERRSELQRMDREGPHGRRVHGVEYDEADVPDLADLAGDD